MSRVVHFEIPVEDPARAGAFYHDVFDWNAEKWGPAEYWMLATGEQPGTGTGAEGAMTSRAEAPEGVLVYIGVDDIDSALQRVKDADGVVVRGKLPIPAIGWSAHVRDTEGNLVGLFQPDPDVTAGPGA